MKETNRVLQTTRQWGMLYDPYARLKTAKEYYNFHQHWHSEANFNLGAFCVKFETLKQQIFNYLFAAMWIHDLNT
ncbi:UNVERIFIED_CONTAM: hypothetical protein NCL1_39821 [Trichonephila clavipes]